MGEERQLRETGDPGIVLSVLSSIERDSAITQRQLARELGIALGLTMRICGAVCARAWSK